MSKFVRAKNFCFQVVNYKNEYPYVVITIPMAYTFLDLLDIIKMYTGYTEEHNFDFYSTYDEIYLSSKYEQNEYDNVKIHEFIEVSPSAICSFGPLKIEIGKQSKSHRKWTKVYPEAFEAIGNFPQEKEFKKLKNVSSKELNKYLTENYLKIVSINSSPRTKKFAKEDLKEFNEKLKEHFKKKYTISDEIYETTWNSNRIILK
jgi:hypothetical protein